MDKIQSAREVIGEYLDRVRKDLGLSFYDLKIKTGLSHHQIMSVFKGNKSYTIDTLLKLSLPLNLYIFFGNKEGKKDQPLDVDHMKRIMDKNDPEL